MTFSPERLAESLSTLPQAGRYWIGFSGGMDSTVLLHALASLKNTLSAPVHVIHVDHGLSPHATEWSRHCEAFCRKLGLPFELRRVDARPEKGESPEAAARRVRYATIKRLIETGDMLLTAHHQDDQAETVLLQLLRGAGPHGLAAMPRYCTFGDGWLGRPLLAFSRSELADYARSQKLEWIDDPSNFDTGLERNFLRHELLPGLRQRKGEIGAVLARSAEHFAEAAMLLDTLAAQDLATIDGDDAASLPVTALCEMEPPRLHNLLRYWFRRRGMPIPDSNRLRRIVDEVLHAAEDGQPLVEWPGAEVRRYRERLYAMPPLPAEPVSTQLDWGGGDALTLPEGLGRLQVQETIGNGIRSELWRQGTVSVRFREGGERCVPAGRGHHHLLKKLFQEAGIPPWWRNRWPLLFIDEQLAAVPGIFVCEPFVAGPYDSGIALQWSRADVAKPGKKLDNA